MAKKKPVSRFMQTWIRFQSFLSPISIPGRLFFDFEETQGEKIAREYGGASMIGLGRTSDEDIRARNSRRLELAQLEQEREATNANLKAQHRLMIITIMTALIALISSTTAVIISVKSKPPVVNVMPNVIVEPNEQETIQKAD